MRFSQPAHARGRLRGRPIQPGHHAGSIAHHNVSNWRYDRARNFFVLSEGFDLGDKGGQYRDERAGSRVPAMRLRLDWRR